MSGHLKSNHRFHLPRAPIWLDAKGTELEETRKAGFSNSRPFALIRGPIVLVSESWP